MNQFGKLSLTSTVVTSKTSKTSEDFSIASKSETDINIDIDEMVENELDALTEKLEANQMKNGIINEETTETTNHNNNNETISPTIKKETSYLNSITTENNDTHNSFQTTEETNKNTQV